MANSLAESYERGAKASAKGGSEKTLESVRIREADNGGFIVSCSWHTKGKGKDMSPGYESSEEVFKDWDRAAEYLDELYGD